MIFLFLSLTAFAQDLRFTPYADLEASAQFRHYRESVHSLETWNGGCTATEISSQGHLLTARHCLQVCLIQSGVFVKRQEQGIDYFVLDREKLGRASCPVKVDGQEEQVVIEATSPGLITYMDQRSFRSLSPALFRRFEVEGYTDRGDFAIVRRPAPGAACVPLSAAAPAGEVHSLGYPGKTERPDGFNSDGEQLYFTQGEVLGSVRENSCAKTLDARRLAEQVKEFDHPGAFMSSLDAIHGSSGSSVLNKAGEVVGVLTKVYSHPGGDPAKDYCRGSAKGLSIEHIRGMLGGLKLSCASVGRE